MEDVRIGRESYREERIVACGATVVQLVAPDPKRTSLIIDVLGAVDVTIGGTNAVTAGRGLIMSNVNEPLKLTLVHHGRWITDGLFAITGGVAVDVLVWSTYLGKE